MVFIKYIGQNGFIVRNEEKSICFDPYLSNCVYELTGSGIRNYESPCKVDELVNIDMYFISHDHLDHLDPVTVKEVARLSKRTKFICPFPYIKKLEAIGVSSENIIGAKTGKEFVVDNIMINAIPERHEDYVIVDGEHGNLGYVILWDGLKIFHAGDAIADIDLVHRLKQFGRFDVMFLPINGHDWKRFDEDIMGNMNYREALDLCAAVGTELVIPMHYDLFANNTENPAHFVDYLYKTYPKQKFKMFVPGEQLILE